MIKEWIDSLRRQSFRMVWQITKNGQRSFVIGTAHFFPISYRHAFKYLFQHIEVAAFEGPLDDASMQQVAEHGCRADGHPDWKHQIQPDALQQIDQLLAQRLDPDGSHQLYSLFQPVQPNYFDQFTQNMRPWMVMFSTWTTYLEWPYSIDMEAYRLALQMGKPVKFLETIKEQLEVLDGIPIERILHHMNNVKNWKTYKNDFLRFYRSGDLQKLLALTNYFPTRTPVVISERDKILFERMLTIIEHQPAAIFVGVPHIPGVNNLLERAGFSIEQISL